MKGLGERQTLSCTSRRGDLCHNRQLGMAAGENSGGHCHRGLAALVAPPAHIVLRDTIGWQDCSLRKPENKYGKREKQKQQLDTDKLKDGYAVALTVVLIKHFHTYISARASYLDVKLQIPLVHLSRDHALDHVHRHQLITLIGRAEDIMSITFLNLDIEEPFPARSAKLMSAGHVHWIFKHRDRAETDSTLGIEEEEEKKRAMLIQSQSDVTIVHSCNV